MEPIVAHWEQFAADALGPVLRMPHHPLRMARFAIPAFTPAQLLAQSAFKSHRARALFAGLAGHSFLSFDQPLSSAVALVLGAAAHAVGWPIPRGGARAISAALVRYLENLGGTVHTSHRVDADGIPILRGRNKNRRFAHSLRHSASRSCSRWPANSLAPGDRRVLSRFQYGPGAFKVDFALSEPVPWRAKECCRAITVHLGGTFEEIAASEHAVVSGQRLRSPIRPRRAAHALRSHARPAG